MMGRLYRQKHHGEPGEALARVDPIWFLVERRETVKKKILNSPNVMQAGVRSKLTARLIVSV